MQLKLSKTICNLSKKNGVRQKLLSSRKNSKTLPRGFTIGPGSESSGDSVFGLYGDLMNVEEYEVQNITEQRLLNRFWFGSRVKI